MRTINKIITKVDCKYGSPMGRESYGKRPIDGTKIYDCAVPLSGDGSYDKGGAYWGLGFGSQLRVAYTKDLSFIRFYRTNDLPRVSWSRDYKAITVNGERMAKLVFEEYQELSAWNMVATIQDWVKKHYVLGDVLVIKNDDAKDSLGVIIDIWDDMLTEVIQTGTFWFEDFQHEKE